MRLGVGYIVFTGGEFLKPSLQNVRPFAKHIVVVVGDRSHAGHKMPKYLKPLLDQLKKEGLIDELIHHKTEPTNAAACMQHKCRDKREIARQQCMVAGCDHYLIRDCDEFHDSKQFQTILDSGWTEQYDVLISQLYEYWGRPSLRAKGISPLYVPFIQKIHFPLKGKVYPVRVDRGRTAIGWKTHKVLLPEELAMHHFTACRYNKRELLRKWQGHGHLNRNWSSGNAYVESVARLIEENEVVETGTQDQFGIVEYWYGEFREFLGSI